MRIIDSHGRIQAALSEHHFDVEDFYSSLSVWGPQEFLTAPLEARSNALLIDVGSLASQQINDALLAMINTYPAVLLFLSEKASVEQETWAQKLLAVSDKVTAIFHLPLKGSEVDLVRNQLLYFWRQSLERQRFREQMVRFSQEMDELVRGAHLEMLKAKKIHEGVVPRRSEDLKAVQLTSKYAVGEGAGSEYFDVIRGQGQVHLVFLHTTSYLASSCLMGLLNKYKGGPLGLEPQLFLQEAAFEIRGINANKKKQVEVQMLLMRIDQATLKCEGYAFGSFELFSQEKGSVLLPQLAGFDAQKIEESRFNITLERGEKVVVFSPGFIFNWNEAREPRERMSFLKDNQALAGPELLMEMFFQLKKKSSGDFLAKDATAVMMEVNRHAIQQV
jgi:hypothetical protein